MIFEFINLFVFSNLILILFNISADLFGADEGIEVLSVDQQRTEGFRLREGKVERIHQKIHEQVWRSLLQKGRRGGLCINSEQDIIISFILRLLKLSSQHTIKPHLIIKLDT